MAETPQDRKTEEPTARRLRETREQGNVPTSRDVSTAAVLVAVLIAIWFGRESVVSQLKLLGQYALESPSRLGANADSKDLIANAVEVFGMVLVLCLPIAIVAAVAAFAINFAQVGGLFAPRALIPDGNRINPVTGAKRIFSLNNTVELIKSVLKIVALSAVLFLVIRWAIPTMVKLPSLNINGVTTVTAVVFVTFFLVTAGIMCLIALFDHWFQRMNYIRENRMTRDEVKRERRDDQGDPHMRSKRREMSVELAGETLLDRTARASIVVSSSVDKLAVALFVDQDIEQLPWILNKGAGQMANAITRVAAQNDIRIIQDARLALALDRDGVVDQDVPSKYADQIRGYFV